LRTAPMRGLVEEVCVESRIQVVVMLVGICRAKNVMLCYGWFTQPTPTTHPPGTRAASFWGRTYARIARACRSLPHHDPCRLGLTTRRTCPSPGSVPTGPVTRTTRR
jgi:hypothetical protein